MQRNHREPGDVLRSYWLASHKAVCLLEAMLPGCKFGLCSGLGSCQ